jgi:hypothetical protein
VRVTVVTGSRAATPEQLAELRSDLEAAQPELVIVGDCPDTFDEWDNRRYSIDKATEDWCDAKGVEAMCGRARWRRRGKGAGPRRNHALAITAAGLAATGHDVSYLDYPGNGTGTQDCVARLERAGIRRGKSP